MDEEIKKEVFEAVTKIEYEMLIKEENSDYDSLYDVVKELVTEKVIVDDGNNFKHLIKRIREISIECDRLGVEDTDVLLAIVLNMLKPLYSISSKIDVITLYTQVPTE